MQVGLQRRSWDHFAQARDEIAKGRLRQVTMIRTYWFQNHIPANGRVSASTSKLDWKRFLGSASDRPFDPDQFGNRRWYWDFGGGAMTDLFVHWVDVAHWLMGSDCPTWAIATGPKAVLLQRQTPDTMQSKQDGTLPHMKNFLNCVKSRKQPNAAVEIGVAAARAGHVANLAMRGNGVWLA